MPGYRQKRGAGSSKRKKSKARRTEGGSATGAGDRGRPVLAAAQPARRAASATSARGRKVSDLPPRSPVRRQASPPDAAGSPSKKMAAASGETSRQPAAAAAPATPAQQGAPVQGAPSQAPAQGAGFGAALAAFATRRPSPPPTGQLPRAEQQAARAGSPLYGGPGRIPTLASMRSRAVALAQGHIPLTSTPLGDRGRGVNGRKGKSPQKTPAQLTQLTLASRRLDVGYNGLRAEHAQAIAEALVVPDSKLAWLELSYNAIGAEGAAHLAEAVALPNCPLATLCLSCNGLGDEGIDLLTAALVKTQGREKGLAAIELGFNRIYSSGVRAFSKCLADGCTLRSVNLSDNGLGNAGCELIAAAVRSPRCRLTTLRLGCNGIGDKGATALAESLKLGASLQVLDLEGNFIEASRGTELHEAELHADAQAQAAANANANNEDDSDTDAEANQSDDDDGGAGNAGPLVPRVPKETNFALAKALESPNCRLTALNLSDNCILDGTAAALATAMSTDGCRLMSLDLSSNCIAVRGAERLSAALSLPHCRITHLDLHGNGVKGALDAEIINSVEKTCAVKATSRLMAAHHRMLLAVFLRCNVGANLLQPDGLGEVLASTIREDSLWLDIAACLPPGTPEIGERFVAQGWAWRESQPDEDDWAEGLGATGLESA